MSEEVVNLRASSIARTPHPACPQWMPDEQSSLCTLCNANFTLFNRRHHCRACGGLFDGKCCSQTMELSQLGFPEGDGLRVCNTCAQKPRNTTSMEKELNSLCTAVETYYNSQPRSRAGNRVKLFDLTAIVCNACAEEKFHPQLLAYGKRILASRLQDDLKEAHTGLVSLRQLGDTAKVSEIMPVTHVAEDVLDSVKKLKGKDLANEEVFSRVFQGTDMEDFEKIYEDVRIVRDTKLNSQREDQRYRECKANLDAVVHTNYTYEYTKEVVDQALYFMEKGRQIPKGTLERAQAKLKVMEQVKNNLSAKFDRKGSKDENKVDS